MEAQNKLKILDLTAPTNNSILSHIEPNRKPSLLEYVLYKMRLFTQSYSKKKFAARLLERNEVDRVMENLYRTPIMTRTLMKLLKKGQRKLMMRTLKCSWNSTKTL